MKASELRRNIRERKREVRESMRAQRKAAQQQLDANPLVRNARRRRRIRRTAGVAFIALLALVSRCACGEPPPPEPVTEAPSPPKEPEKPPARPAAKLKPKRLRAKTAQTDRGSFQGQARTKASWVDEYRLQVAARSSRLSSCFTGIDKPGAIRWTASLNPESGTVSDHDLEALAASSPIWKKERECLIQALSNPPYRLPSEAATAEGIPNRMSIVIEF